MDTNENNIKIEKINQKFKNYESMEESLYFEGVERLKGDTIKIISLLLYTGFIWCMVFILQGMLTFLFVLLTILYSDIILLYFSIISDIIIPDKLKEIYEKAYYVYGEISIGSSLRERINEVFFKPEEIDDFLGSLMSDAVLEKRKCFKCQIEMNYAHFYRNNMSEIPMHQLEKIWKSPHIQLFCCRCYKTKLKKLLFKKWGKKTGTIY